MPSNYWVISAGDNAGRDYSGDFFKYGMAFVGGTKNEKTLERIMVGDKLILKQGNQKILAVGIVEKRNGRHFGKEDKEWLRDYDGWDLPAYCFVKWFKSEAPIECKVRQGTIYSANGQLKKIADEIVSCVKSPEIPQSEPRDVDKYEDKELLEDLVLAGLRPSSAEELTIAINRIRLLANYYYNSQKNELFNWSDIREHETRTFLVIPLLLALGWSEQQLKIELGINYRKRIDIACFNKPYRRTKKEPNNENCVLIIETKDFSSGLDYAHDQAKSYTSEFSNCNAVVATNGFCYKAYGKKNGAFSNIPYAYLNLLSPKRRYPLDPNVGGALDLLKCLLPQTYYFD